MRSFVIDNVELIEVLTGRSSLTKILLHLDSNRFTAKYEEAGTLFELTRNLPYFKTVKILKENNLL